MSDKVVVGVGGHDWDFDECWATAARLSDEDVANWARDHVNGLLAQRDELRALNERLVSAGNVDELRAEVERLRAALSEITDLELEGDASLGDAIVIADEALNPSPATSAIQT